MTLLINVLILMFIFLGALKGYSMKFLTKSGSIAAAVVGILIFVGFHVKGLCLLAVFFLTSSYWSRYKKNQKTKVEERLAKGSQRDFQQVLANGGGAAAASFLYYMNPEPIWTVAFAIFIASSNSDTWASEIGTLSKKRPVSIRHFSTVPKGTSGAVSFLGTSAAILGALLIAMLSFFLFGFQFYVALLIFLFGFFGNIIDTILGAYFQASYKCEICGIDTEKLVHCREQTVKVSGYSILNNDLVNFLSSLIATFMGVYTYSLIY